MNRLKFITDIYCVAPRCILLATLFFCLSLLVLGQEVLTEVDLTVNGFKSGTSYTTILKRIGKPSHERKTGFDECGGGFRKTIYYPGLNVGLLSNEKGKRFTIISLTVTSSKWIVFPSVKIGMNKQIVRKKYGKPIANRIPGEDVLFYVTKENLGGVAFYFKNNKLVRVEMQETLC